ncbi:MAG TPA: DUF4386 domain-containing protein [Clostridia bacterium]|nr:DUF4386 domain-containing protein [Clostridia bacterium]
MDNNKKIARMVGVLFIIGTVSGILSAVLVPPVLNAADYLVKISENKNIIVLGVLLILTMGISLSIMSVVLYPVIKKYNETLALGAVVFRGALELVSYLGIAISWLLLITLSQEYVSAGMPTTSNFSLMGTMSLDVDSRIGSMGLVAIVFCIGALIIYYVFYKTKLIPTWLSLWGLIGAILYIINPILLMFGFDFGFLVFPLAVQEMVMAVWLIVKGFNSSAFDSLSSKTAMN